MCLILGFVCNGSSQADAISPENVVVLVNKNDHGSIDLGYYYALKRDVPIENIVHLEVSGDEQISWDAYIEQIYNPLLAWLLEAGWFEGFGSDRKDAFGRTINLVESHRVDALVICKGVPLRIKNDPAKLPPKDSIPKDRIQFYSARASVDSELAALPFPKARIDGFYPNPMYRRTEPRELFDVKPLVVGRLDGPTYESATALVDNAILAETEGIAGRAYIDLKGPHQAGDDWLEATRKILTERGFDIDTHEGGGRFNLVDRFDEPLFYFGWYTGGLEGPFTHYNFKFPPGAIALHIHSFSAATIRNGHQFWVGPLVARGVTATLGNTSEPYLGLTHQPHFFVEALYKGMTTGEAALYSIMGLSWVGVLVGDPLYLPPLGLKMSPKNEYDVLLTANRAHSAGDDSAFKAVVYEHEKAQHFATGLWLHRYYFDLNNQEKAYEYLQSIARPSAEETRNWGILLEIAEGFYRLGYGKPADLIIEDLLRRTDSKRELEMQLLKRAIEFAEEYEQSELRSKWAQRLEILTAPPKKEKK